MPRPLADGTGFTDDADPSQPRVTITIDGGIALTDAERVLRDHMVAPFVDELVTAIRAYYDVRRGLGPAKRPVDAEKLAAAIARMEATTE